jgi:hypothetical protein
MTGEIPFDLDDLEVIAQVLEVEVVDLLPRLVGSSRGAGDAGGSATQTIV